MNKKIIVVALIAVCILQSCHRAMTPYEAANHPKGKKCRDIK
jgi:hypothetical protein